MVLLVFLEACSFWWTKVHAVLGIQKLCVQQIFASSGWIVPAPSLAEALSKRVNIRPGKMLPEPRSGQVKSSNGWEKKSTSKPPASLESLDWSGRNHRRSLLIPLSVLDGAWVQCWIPPATETVVCALDIV